MPLTVKNLITKVKDEEMESLIKLTESEKMLLESREFIEWMIEELDSDSLSVLLVAIGIEKQFRQQTKLPKSFLKNKLLLKNGRLKLRDKKILPPFVEFFSLKNEELSVDKIIEVFKSANFSPKNQILILFLQNHYSEAIKMYEEEKDKPKNEEIKGEEEEKRIEEKNLEKETHTKKGNEVKSVKNEKKAEKKINQKIENLEKINQSLILNIEELKTKNKNSNDMYLQEKNQYKRELASMDKDLTEARNRRKELEEELKLKENEISVLNNKVASYEEQLYPKRKIAYIGESKNVKVNNYYPKHPEIIDLEHLAEIKNNDFWIEFDEIHCLSFELTQAVLRRLRKNVPVEKLKVFNNINSLTLYIKKEHING